MNAKAGLAGRWRSLTLCGVGTLFATAELSQAQVGPASGSQPSEVDSQDPAEELLDLSLEELLEVEVTSVSKRQERLFTAPAAISALTEDDIRRSGMRRLPDLFRLVPGMHVGQITANHWAISARGFADQFANKLQVLSDGRTLYTHLFSGVYWQAQVPMLSDLERIEIIRGPGAALWGANAVNGVINIISKEARETQGGYVEAGSGSELEGFSAFRYGDQISDDVYYRVYAHHQNQDSQRVRTGEDGADDSQVAQAGFRIDGYGSADARYTLQGDLMLGKFGGRQVVPLIRPTTTIVIEDEEDFAGGNLLGRYSLGHGDDLRSTLQVYYDRQERTSRLTADTTTDTIDLDYQLDWSPVDSHQVAVGFGYRALFDRNHPSQYIDIHNRSRSTHLLSAFVQDQIELIDDQLQFTAGTKVEHQPYTGVEVQPSVRLSFQPTERQTLWGAVSRAIRSPSRYEDEGRIRINTFTDPGTGLPTEITIYGDKSYAEERLTSYELGYRVQPHESVSIDVSAFVNDYDNLNSLENGAPFVTSAGTVVIPQFFENQRRAQAYGLEMESRWRVTDSWRLIGTYAFFKIMDRPKPTGRLTPLDDLDDNSPRNQATLRSQLDVTDDIEIDAFLSYVDVISAQSAPAYLRADLRFGWRPTDSVELALVGQNLLDRRHPEFQGQIGIVPTEVERAIYFSVALRF